MPWVRSDMAPSEGGGSSLVNFWIFLANTGL